MTNIANVSVVMATFNGARFIDKQLRSLARQTLLPRELILSDDGSTDDTVEIVAAFREAAPFPVTLVRNEHRLGYGGNFLSAARLATSEMIAFCDQDDIWLPRKLETAVEMLRATDADLFVHTAHLIDETDRPIGTFTQSIRRREIIPPLKLPPWGVFYGFSMVFRREVLDIVDPDLRGGHTFEFDGDLSHDLWIYFVSASLGRIVTDDRPLVLYRRHGRNATPNLSGTLLQAISKKLGLAAHPSLDRSGIARNRAKILRSLHRSDPSGRLGRQALRAADYWDRIARIEASRTRLYTHDNALRRASEWTGVAFRGGYRSWPQGGLGWPLLLKDGLSGVLQIKRPGVSHEV